MRGCFRHKPRHQDGEALGAAACQAGELWAEQPGLTREPWRQRTENLECQTVAFILGLMHQ